MFTFLRACNSEPCNQVHSLLIDIFHSMACEPTSRSDMVTIGYIHWQICSISTRLRPTIKYNDFFTVFPSSTFIRSTRILHFVFTLNIRTLHNHSFVTTRIWRIEWKSKILIVWISGYFRMLEVCYGFVFFFKLQSWCNIAGIVTYD